MEDADIYIYIYIYIYEYIKKNYTLLNRVNIVYSFHVFRRLEIE
jgi:hypothetical protein